MLWSPGVQMMMTIDSREERDKDSSWGWGGVGEQVLEERGVSGHLNFVRG